MSRNPNDMADTMKLNCSLVYFIATAKRISVYILEKRRSLFTQNAIGCSFLFICLHEFQVTTANLTRLLMALLFSVFFFFLSMWYETERECVCVSVWYDKYVCVRALRCMCISLQKIRGTRGLQFIQAMLFNFTF